MTADFLTAFEPMILSEGGYKLHKVTGDTGGLTYAGIARNKNPGWAGWACIDRGETPPSDLVRSFYRTMFWEPLRCSELSQDVANSLFGCAVNTSAAGNPTTAVKLAQTAVGATPDGVMGPKTLAAINAMDERLFLALFTIAKITRYAAICNKKRTQSKFLLGWVNRALGEM